jgi:hypothetical protein
MNAQPGLAYTLGDGTIPPSDLPPVMQVWWGDHHGAPLGLMTDEHGPWPPAGDRADLALLGRAAAVTKILVDERVWAATTRAAERPDLQAIAAALLRVEWRPLTIVADNTSVASAAVTFVGLDFVVGNVGTPHPFVMAHSTGNPRPWPSLITVSA